MVVVLGVVRLDLQPQHQTTGKGRLRPTPDINPRSGKNPLAMSLSLHDDVIANFSGRPVALQAVYRRRHYTSDFY